MKKLFSFVLAVGCAVMAAQADLLDDVLSEEPVCTTLAPMSLDPSDCESRSESEAEEPVVHTVEVALDETVDSEPVAEMQTAAVTPIAAARENSCIAGFFVGCCFGVRNAAAWNDGKQLHWKDWGTIIPFAGWVVAIINGIDGMSGTTTADLASRCGSQYY